MTHAKPVSGAGAVGGSRLRQASLRQRMSGLHIWAGLLCGWLLYAMFLTGTVAYFREEQSQWMRPELPAPAGRPDQAAIAQRVADAFGDTPQWTARLPDGRSNTVYAFWRERDGGPRRFAEGWLDPATGRAVEARDTLGGEFFYRFHFQFHHLSSFWGQLLAGLAAMFMLVAIISGIITHKKIFVDFFTFRWGKGQRAWLDAHNALSVFGLPFHLMITYTGLITLMAMYMPWGQQAGIRTPAERQALSAQLAAVIPPVRASGEAVPLASVADMVRQAQAHWGGAVAGYVSVSHAGDAAARVSVSRGEAGRLSMSPQYVLFEGATGKQLAVHDSVGAAAETRGVLYGLHLGRFSDSVTRWLYFIVSLAGTAMVGTVLVLWTVKRRQKLTAQAMPSLGLRMVERINVAAIAGLSLAMTAMLWANRLLPVDGPGRAGMEVQVFFGVWGVLLLHALLRPVRQAWREQLWLAAAALALLPILNALTTARPLWKSLAQGDWVFAGADMLFLALALLHALLAWRVRRTVS